MENDWIEEFRELMSEFRKSTYEFAQSGHPDDYGRMMQAQRSLYQHALLKA